MTDAAQPRAAASAAATKQQDGIGGGDDSEGMGYLETLPRRLITTYLPLGIMMIVLLFPFYWMALTSVKPDKQLLDLDQFNPFWTTAPTLKHYYALLFQTNYPRWLWNTMFVSITATILSLIASVLAAYAIVRLKYRGAQAVGGSSSSPTSCRLQFCSFRCRRWSTNTACSTRRSR